MKQASKNDLRYLKTKNAIHIAFKQLLTTQPYEKITVKDLSLAAKINRKTFYLHYNTLDDLLLELRNELSLKLFDIISQFEIPTDLKLMIQTIYEYWRSSSEIDLKILDLASAHSSKLTLSEQLRNQKFHYTTAFPITSSELDTFASVFVTHTITSVYHEWIHYHRDMKLEEAVDIAYTLISHGIYTKEPK